MKHIYHNTKRVKIRKIPIIIHSMVYNIKRPPSSDGYELHIQEKPEIYSLRIFAIRRKGEKGVENIRIYSIPDSFINLYVHGCTNVYIPFASYKTNMYSCKCSCHQLNLRSAELLNTFYHNFKYGITIIWSITHCNTGTG